MLTTPLTPSVEKKDKGFTLIELLVVVVIIGVLAAIAIPIFLDQKDKAAEAGVKSDIKNASTYLETFYVDSATYAGSQAYLDHRRAPTPPRPATRSPSRARPPAPTASRVSDSTGNEFHLTSTGGAVEADGCP